MLSVIDDKGNIHGEAGESFIGMPRFLARNKVCLALKDLGLYRGEMPHDMMLPLCRYVICHDKHVNFVLRTCDLSEHKSYKIFTEILKEVNMTIWFAFVL